MSVFINALTFPILHEVSSVGSLTEKVSAGQNVLGRMELPNTDLQRDFLVMLVEKVVVIFLSVLLCRMWRMQLQGEQKVHVVEG